MEHWHTKVGYPVVPGSWGDGTGKRFHWANTSGVPQEGDYGPVIIEESPDGSTKAVDVLKNLFPVLQ